MLRRQAFTLVEMMIAIAVIGVLAAIAIPIFEQTRLQAKRAELPAMMSGILVAAAGYEMANDERIQVLALQPDETPSKAQRPWVRGTGFDTIGWAPDGEVRGSYMMEYNEELHYVAYGACDVDSDGNWSWWLADDRAGIRMMTETTAY